ncbi:MAG: hypothetical protein IT162_11045 [Bryobacterales bacterium]|nr:hypothetical protein [Bryobacterales bacterium]
MTYESSAIQSVPRAAASPLLQHALDTYASETNKVVSVWTQFTDADLDFRPHERSMTVRETMRHQLLSERRFFAEFLGSPEPPAAEVLPAEDTVAACTARFVELARPRLDWLAARELVWWLATSQFFGVPRERVWIFWRRVLHTAHHRTQLSGNLRLLGKPVVPTYGPTADVTWDGASPTLAPLR